MKNFKNGFTLAEVLITLMIIGVVAVLTIPAMITGINDKVLERQQDVFTKKFTEGLRQMRVDGKLSQKYARTEDFVAEMQKYFKISAVCENTNLAGCFQENFSYEGTGVTADENKQTGKYEITNDESKNFTLTNGMKAKNIKSSISEDKNTDVMGVVFADGVQMLLYVNPECEGPSEGDTQGNVTSCISYLADVNQAKSPNQVEKDIVSNISFANIEFEIASAGAVAPGGGEWDYMAKSAETPEVISKYKLQYQASTTEDYWGGAMKYCQDLTEDGGGWHLPDAEQLTKLAKAMGYADPSICTTPPTTSGNPPQPYYQGCSANSAKITNNALFKKIGGNSTSFSLWSSVSYNYNYANYRTFDTSASHYLNYPRLLSNTRALCIR